MLRLGLRLTGYGFWGASAACLLAVIDGLRQGEVPVVVQACAALLAWELALGGTRLLRFLRPFAVSVQPPRHTRPVGRGRKIRRRRRSPSAVRL